MKWTFENNHVTTNALYGVNHNKIKLFHTNLSGKYPNMPQF